MFCVFCKVSCLSLPHSTVWCFNKTHNLTLSVCTLLEKTQRLLKLQNTTKNPCLTYSHYFGVDLGALGD